MGATHHPEEAAIPSSAAKRRPPLPAVTVIERPAVQALLRRAERRAVVAVTAGPGWGKTTLLASWARARGMAWYAVDADDRDAAGFARGLLAARGVDAATEGAEPAELGEQVLRGWLAAGPGAIVLDDVDAIADSPGAELLRHVRARASDELQLVVAARADTGLVDDRQRAAGAVLELDATHLALDTEAVADLLDAELSPDRALAARIVELTGGWPAAIRLVLEALHDVAPDERPRRVATLAAAAGPVSAYVRAVVLPETDEWTRRLLVQLALLDRTAPDRVATVTGLAAPAAVEAIDGLVARGLAHRAPPTGDGGGTDVALAPAVRAAVLERHLPERDDAEQLVDEVVARLLDAGHVDDALAVLTAVARGEAAADLLERHGDDLLHGGALALVVSAAAGIPRERRTPRIERLHGQALAFRGEWSAALRCFDAHAPDTTGPLTTRDATGLGLVHHLRGDLDAALATYARGPEEEDTPEFAELLGWRATAHWLCGETDTARRFADAAMASATRHQQDRMLALAHTAQALVAASAGDRRANEAHYRQALTAARRAGDVIQQARVLTNLGSLHLEQGDHDTALGETEEAIDLADEQGFAMILSIARCNRSEIHLRTGALDEAIADAEHARDLFARIGSRHESYAHHLLGDARREQGDLVLAQQAYERSLRLAGPSGDKQGRVPALVGLARTLAGTDPDAAEYAAKEALALDDGMHRAQATLAAAWIALARQDPQQAGSLAADAREEAQRREDRHSVAEATTLLAVLDDDPVPGLRHAATLWWQVNARVSAARVELGAARRSTDPAGRARVETLEQRLRTWGCSVDRGAFAHQVVVATDARPRTAIRMLGGFVVEREGRPVPRSAWGSRKARDLLKVLVVRGRRGVAREELADLLWPDEPYDAVSNRLSVALSVVRSVLAGGDRTGDGVVQSDGPVVRLDLEQVEVDVERFWRLAEDGLAAARRGEDEHAVPLLTSAEQVYAGDLLEDDRDALWLVDRREELRSTYVSVARTLAGLLVADDPDLAMRLLLRVLDRDPFDEPAHLGVSRALLRAGRHGEARRRHRLYTRRMEELDLAAVPFQDLHATPP